MPIMSLEAPDFGSLSLTSPGDRFTDQTLDYRLFRIEEIGADKPSSHRQSMANVFSTLNSSGCACVYIISGRPEGIELYIGVAASPDTPADVHESSKTCRSGFEGNFLGARLTDVHSDDAALKTMLARTRHVGLMTGVPSFNQESSQQHPDEEDAQGVERLVNSLLGETWQLTIVAEPATDADVRQTLEQVYDLASDLSEHIKQSGQHSRNTGQQTTRTTGSSNSDTDGTSTSETQGTSQGQSTTSTGGTSNSTTKGSSSSDTRGENKGVSEGKSTSQSEGTSRSSSSSGSNSGSTRGDSKGTSTGFSTSKTTGRNDSHTDGETRSLSQGTNSGSNTSSTTGTSASRTTGRSDSEAKGESNGSSDARNWERIDKRSEGLLKHLDETLIDRFKRGRSKGMYRTAIYLSAEHRSTYERLTRGALAIFQGNQSGMTPLRVHALSDLPRGTGASGVELSTLLQLRHSPMDGDSVGRALVHSTPLAADGQLCAATWLNTEELALIAGLPTRELPGLTIRQSVDFALNTSRQAADVAPGITLGQIVQHGRALPHSVVRLSPQELRKHVFVTGVTGAGKTTTCLKLLLESGMPFMVIEPAKTEYRALHGVDASVEYYCLGREDLGTFRLNPFELVSRQQSLASHIDTLKATLAAVFPMEAAMPQIVEEAIINAYTRKGWMIHENENLLTDDPWATDSDVWPTFSDMIGELDAVIKSKGLGREFEEKYQGSLVARLSSLTLGTKGRMLNTRRSMNIDTLLDKRVVIELEELKDEQDKALLMGLILTRVAECMKQRHRQQPGFQHLTLVEEAHRLLSRPEPGDPGSKKMGVEMFANLLAEVRKYGEGLIIADQIPNKLVSDVIKNTNTKIVHRLFAADDRNTIGDAMGLTEEQKDFLPMLQPGETIIYCGGWHGAVRLKITESVQTHGTELDEATLQRQGRAQLWAQRHFLLPKLAALPLLDNPERLAEFLRDGLLMLNLLLRLNPKVKAKAQSSSDARLRGKMRDRFVALHEGWRTRPGFDASAVADGLCRVFQDCSAQNPTVFSAEDADIFRQALAGSIQGLLASTTAFDRFVDSMASNEIFDSLRHINSI
ncbi:hypothetical protein [Sphaerotilus sp.]|uniref:hypothetical protein n=1 Tax=Sphaerotilus sp. TaxID=2093942 RepID=UPI002ACE9FED|nr:hypothetical protein [Sphaerotilus sp.]MDZ7855051.1 hypothetical protein [Sphaerotilus sp.]